MILNEELRCVFHLEINLFIFLLFLKDIMLSLYSCPIKEYLLKRMISFLVDFINFIIWNLYTNCIQ